MKHIYKYILLVSILWVPFLSFAQTQLEDPAIFADYKESGGVATSKVVEGPDGNGFYTLTLETFATGETTLLTKAIPSDIILLLDYSSSMLTNDNITKLKSAVVTFVNQMKANNQQIAGSLQPGQPGNRIAFVLYAGLLYDDYPQTTQRVRGNGSPYLNDYPYFNAKYVNQFIEVSSLNANGTSVLYQDVNIIAPSSQHASHPSYLGGSNFGDTNKGTNTPAAMAKALELVNANLQAYSSDQRSTTVVLFTDGEPCDVYMDYYYNETGHSDNPRGGFTYAYANTCLADAKTIKGKGVNIFSVGLFNYGNENSTAHRQTRSFVEYTSSNYPEVAPTANNYWTTESNLKNINDPMNGDYCKIVSDGLDLSGVFKTIAESSGGSKEAIPAQTEIRDIVSNSFSIPDGFNINDVTVYTLSPTTDGTGWETYVPQRDNLTVVEAHADDVLTGTNPAPASYITDESKVGLLVNGSKLTLLGFIYSKPDTDATSHDGNWVGWRVINNQQKCYGKKLVVTFKIKADPNATGGDGTSTNSKDSGVYVPIFDDDGNITGYTNVNSYDIPHADLPVNLVIKKTGLRHGESATIQVYMARQLVIDGKVKYDDTTGKPLPDLRTDANGKYIDGAGWQNFSKVILTNKGTDGATVEKTLLCLFPEYVYRLEEDNWGWAYELDTNAWDTSQVEKNPFTFINKENPDAVKHAEAVSINHFGPGYTDEQRVERYKSSKVESFSNPTN